MGYVVMSFVGLVIGFAAGFLLVKRSTRWCPSCGSDLKCTRCTGNPTLREVRPTLWERRRA